MRGPCIAFPRRNLRIARWLTVDDHEDSAWPQRRVDAAIQTPLGVSRADVMQREGRDYGIAGGQRRLQKAVDDECRARPKPPRRRRKHVCIRIDADDRGSRRARQAARRQRTGSDPQVDDAPRSRRHSVCGHVEHLLIERNERADARVIFTQADPEMRGDAHGGFRSSSRGV